MRESLSPSLSPFQDLEGQRSSTVELRLSKYDSSDESLFGKRRTTISFGQNQLKEYVPEVEYFCCCFKDEETAKNFQFMLVVIIFLIVIVGIAVYTNLSSE
ncbi:Oidioi.mRNA.OKI2018_I69.chr1.g1263.t1.cds [Oikopleura dioica]|uniref:Oidioi.mRNA.OKI2018_I69.chr1.g1263.t1.cds n=1 Tax=Oikopleura dioica TaxID=34765 RepID=A0ABN7STQ8_OIKDI|nr:Oidioi.mRNA.OKI2018_I69.chr1.g1263.t1.cds [Oikopleura dioica]